MTQVHGSMEGKEVLKLVEKIQSEKDAKLKLKQEKSDNKDREKEIFYRCKEKCVCNKEQCLVVAKLDVRLMVKSQK